MIGIADSGSTKTEWCFLNETGEEKRVVTGGLNPFVTGEEDIRRCLEKDLYPFIHNTKVRHLFFYGSGCAENAKKNILQTELDEFFPNAEVSIESDLIGAALALCGAGSGLVAILGTGASTCFYDGKAIVSRVPSLGYILGDEGSGARIGLRFLADYLRGGMPEELKSEFASLCPMSVHEVIDTVYHGREVGRFLGEMAVFAEGKYDHPYIKEVLLKEFTAFFRTQILPYGVLKETYEVNMLGSIAYYMQELVARAAETCGVKIGKVLRTPIDGLIERFRPKIGELLGADPPPVEDFR